MVITAINLYFSFQNADEDLKPWDHDEAVHSSSTSVELENLDSRITNTTNNANTTTQTSEMVLALQSHVTWLIAFFCLCYQGAEVSLAGWIVTFC